MITGLVNHRHEAIVRVRVILPGRKKQDIDAIVDTGYTGFLTLAPQLVAQLGLMWLGSDTAVLANGTTQAIDIYAADVEWNAAIMPIFVDQIDAPSLLGMSLLDGYNLSMDVIPQGAVTIQCLSQNPS